MTACGNNETKTSGDVNNNNTQTEVNKEENKSKENEVKVESNEDEQVKSEVFFDASKLNTFAATQELLLEGNATTGYTWNYEVLDNTIVSVSGEYVTNEAPEGMAGVGGVQHYTITGLAQGTTTMRCYYSRSWETDVTPIKDVVFDIEVNENNEVAIIAER